MKWTFVLISRQLSYILITVLGITNCSVADCSYNESRSYSENATVPPLLKLEWTTVFTQTAVNPNFVILSGFSNTELYLNKDVFQFTFTSLEPIEMIFQETLNSSIKNPSSTTARRANVPGAAVSAAIEDFKFLIKTDVELQYLLAEGSVLFQCRYIQSPCIGKAILLTYNSENETITLQTDDFGSNMDPKNESAVFSFPAQPAITSGNSNIANKPCDAYFYYNLEVAKFENGFVPYSIACSLRDGTPGNIEILKIYLSSVIRNSFRSINFQPSKCWKPLVRNESSISPTTLDSGCRNCHRITLENLLPIVPICTHSNEIDNMGKSKMHLKIGSFALFGIPRDDATGIPSIILPGNDLPTESMIRMEIKSSDKINHILNTYLRVDCLFSRYYLSSPFRFAVEYENDYGNGTTLEFQPETPSLETWWMDWYTENTFLLKSVNIKRVICLAVRKDKDEWINASRPITISQTSNGSTYGLSKKKQGGVKPFFLNEPDALTNSTQENSKRLPTVWVTFDEGSKNKNITCRAGGFPLPKLTWNYVNNAITESKSGISRHGASGDDSHAWSEIQFSKVTAATAGDYVCYAINDLGSASINFRIGVTANCGHNESSGSSGNEIVPALINYKWTTVFTQTTVNPNFVILSGLSNAELNVNQDAFQITFTSLEPIEIIFQETLNSLIENPSRSIERRDNVPGAAIIEDFKFSIKTGIDIEHLFEEGSILLQCRYIQSPCQGKSIFLTNHSKNDTITIQIDDLRSNMGRKTELTGLTFPAQPDIIFDSSDIADKPCDAYFYYNLEVAKFQNGFVPYSIACSLKDGTPGKIETLKIYLSSVFRNSFRGINFQPSKCWKPLITDDSTISPTTLNSQCANCSRITLDNLLPIVPICTNPNEMANTRNSKMHLKIGSFARFGIPHDDATGIADIILPGTDFPTESMIRIEIKSSDKTNHLVNTRLTVDCIFFGYYLSSPFRIALEYENDYGNGTTLDFQADTSSDRTWWEDPYTENTLLLKSVNIKRVYCLAVRIDRDEWVNASRPITVSTGIKPFILTESDTFKETTLEDPGSLPVVSVNFDEGSYNQNVTCRAGGFPLPEPSWKYLNKNFPESRNGVERNGATKNHSYAWSEIQFSKVTAATAGDYVCKAVNDFGGASIIFRISVTETSSLVAISAVSAVFSAILLVCCVFAIVQVRKVQEQRKIIRSLTDDEIQEFFEGNRNLNKDHPQNEALSKAFDQSYEVLKENLKIEEGKLLGSGNFGTVMQGCMIVNHPSEEDSGRCVETKTLVAIKTVKSNVDVMHVKALLSEIKIMAFLGAHPNIVQLLGTLTANIRKGEIFVAVEFCANGDLRNYLKKLRNDFDKTGLNARTDEGNSYVTVTEINETKTSAATDADTTDTDTNHFARSSENEKIETFNSHTTMNLLKWSAEIASGLTYLSLKKIIHGDLAARNVLLTDTKMAKISDFGLSKQLLNDYTVYAKKSDTPLPWKWLALEALKFQNFSIQSDTWSFGVVLWEIFSMAEIPYPGFNYDENFLDKLDGGFRLRQPQFANGEIYKIMTRCWERLPENRPDAQQIHEELMNVIKGFE